MKWFQNYREENNLYLPSQEKSEYECVLLSLVDKERLKDLAVKNYWKNQNFYLMEESGHYQNIMRTILIL